MGPRLCQSRQVVGGRCKATSAQTEAAARHRSTATGGETSETTSASVSRSEPPPPKPKPNVYVPPPGSAAYTAAYPKPSAAPLTEGQLRRQSELREIEKKRSFIKSLALRIRVDNPWLILGLSMVSREEALELTEKQIKVAYAKRSLEFHPDKAEKNLCVRSTRPTVWTRRRRRKSPQRASSPPPNFSDVQWPKNC